MHSIERYGIVALLFLVVTVVAVLMWDGGKERGKKKPVAGLTPVAASAPAAVDPAPEADAGSRLSLVAESQPGPLQRRARAHGARAADPAAVPAPGPIGGGVADLVPTGAEESGAPLYDTPLTPIEAREDAGRDPAVGAAPAAASHTYTVQSGDTLSEIAQQQLGSSKRWREIVAANPGLDPAKLRLGSKIQVPGAKTSAASTKLASAPTAEAKKPVPASAQKPASVQKPGASGKTWKVGAGESLWRIAEKTLGDGKRWREIAALNPKVNPDRLGAGTVLVLPAGASSAAPARTTPAPKRTTSPKVSPTVVASSNAPERGSRSGGRVR